MADDDPSLEADKLLAALDFAAMTEAQQEKQQQAMTRLLLGFLEILDTLEALEIHCAELADRGLDHVPHRTVSILVEQMLALLAEADVKPVTAVGCPLDLEIQDVVAVRADPAVEPDTVLEEARRGYLWHQRLLRRARVIVAGPAPDPNTEPPHNTGGRNP